MNVFHKLAAGYLLIAVLIGLLGLISARASRRALYGRMTELRAHQAAELIDAVDRRVQGRIETFVVLAGMEGMQRALEESNRAFEATGDGFARTKELDAQWATDAGRAALLDDLMRTRVSRDMAHLTRFYDTAYPYDLLGEVFVTNRYGGVVALSSATTDYQQDDEEWWQKSMRDGMSVEDIAWDESAGVWAVAIGVRVDDPDGAPLGVVKAVLNVEDALYAVRSPARREGGIRYTVLTRDGRVAYSSGDYDRYAPAPESLREAVLNGRDGLMEVEHEDGTTTMCVAAESTGYRDYAGLGWVVALEEDERTFSAPVRQLVRKIWYTCALVLAVGLGVGWLISRHLAERLDRLERGTLVLGAGDLSHRVGTDDRDEIGELSRAIDRMAENLQVVTAGRDELDREVKERLRVEEKLEENAEKLERSNRQLEEFAYVASHDLQEPLRKVRAFGQILQETVPGKLEETERDYLARMISAAERMSGLIADLLALSRVNTRGGEPRAVDTNAVLADVLKDLDLRVEELGAEVVVGDLPEVWADPTQIHQLLQNLLTNALKFTREGVKPRVTVSGETFEDEDGDVHCRLSVKDNGIGFKQQFAEQIFGVFQRLHERGKYEGTGIGLAVCHQIARRHGGGIRAVGRPGEGAEFIVTLPAPPRDAQPSEEPEEGGQA